MDLVLWLQLESTKMEDYVVNQVDNLQNVKIGKVATVVSETLMEINSRIKMIK